MAVHRRHFPAGCGSGQGGYDIVSGKSDLYDGQADTNQKRVLDSTSGAGAHCGDDLADYQ